jgi:hypothetical protein
MSLLFDVDPFVGVAEGEGALTMVSFRMFILWVLILFDFY